MANITSVTTGFFPETQEGFTTTTSGSVASGATTVGLNSVAGYTNGAYVTLVIEPTDVTKKQVFHGQVDTSGTQITNVKWTEGTNQTHNAGVSVVDYETATAWNAQRKGFLVNHNEDGTQKPFTESNIIPTAAIQDYAITASKIATGAITLGYAQITSNFANSGSTSVQVTGLSASVTVPGNRRVKVTFYCRDVFRSGGGAFNLTIWDGAVGTGTQLQQASPNGASGTAFPITMMWVSDTAPAAGAKTYNIGINPSGASTTIESTATSPAFILVEAI